MNPNARMLAESEVPLDFEALVADYEAGLLNRLRGFGAGGSHLDLWVPDEDPLKSIENMLDAAASMGAPELRLTLGEATLGRIDHHVLLNRVSAFGTATLRIEGTCGQLVVAGLRLPTIAGAPAVSKPLVGHTAQTSVEQLPFPSAPEFFPGQLGTCYRLPPGAVSPAPPTGRETSSTVSTAERGGVLLEVGVDASSVVVSAKHQGAPTEYACSVLDVLCNACVGRPVVDVRDHAVARMEVEVRRVGHQTPVPGIVVPETADPVFAWLQALLRDAVAPLMRGAQRINEFDPGPRARWREMDGAARRRAAEVVLGEFARRRGLDPGTFGVVGIDLDVRVTVSVDGVSAAATPGLVLAAERALKRDLEPRLEVFVEEFKDRNKKRRLAVVQPGGSQ